VILGMLTLFAETIYLVLEKSGLSVDFLVLNGFPVLKIVLGGAPFVFFIFAFAILILRRE